MWRPRALAVLVRAYGRDAMPRRHPRNQRSGHDEHLIVPDLSAALWAPQPVLPRPGHPLADAVVLGEHCLERYRLRAGRPAEWRLRTLRRELHELITSRGVAVQRPPSWFFGGLGATLFYITIDGRWLMPVQAARRADGVHPASPYVATTFISKDFADGDLAAFTGEELAALILLPRRIARTWPGAVDADRAPEDQLRDAIAAGGRAHAEAPAWVRTRRPQRDRFYVTLRDGSTIIVMRARRDEGHGSPFRAVELLHEPTLRGLRGDALLEAVILDYPAIRQYRERVAGVPDDARRPLQQRIRDEGVLADELPAWTGGRATWDPPVLLLGDDAALLLQPVVRAQDDGPERWRVVGCIGRPAAS